MADDGGVGESETSDDEASENFSDSDSIAEDIQDGLLLNFDEDDVMSADGEAEEDAGEGDGAKDADVVDYDDAEAHHPGGASGVGSAPPAAQIPVGKGSLKANELTLSAEYFAAHVDEFAVL